MVVANMDYLEDYRWLVIKPLEEMKEEVIRKYFKSFFFKKRYKELLDRIEAEKYEKYYEMSVDEYNFQKYIENELGKDMWKHIFLFVSVSDDRNMLCFYFEYFLNYLY